MTHHYCTARAYKLLGTLASSQSGPLHGSKQNCPVLVVDNPPTANGSQQGSGNEDGNGCLQVVCVP